MDLLLFVEGVAPDLAWKVPVVARMRWPVTRYMLRYPLRGLPLNRTRSNSGYVTRRNDEREPGALAAWPRVFFESLDVKTSGN